jgi:prepilin-type N-terminal cleavage/methylation domain-containing protein
MRHRPGVTLVEVLMAIFVMGIGMLALLVLFPLGALSVAQALRDDRAAQAATNATGWADAIDLRHDAQLMNNPDSFSNPFPTLMAPLASPYSGPSFPVYVDPYYVNLGQSTLGAFTAGANRITPGIARRSLSLSGLIPGRAQPLSPQETTRWFTLLDDITFTSGDTANGQPELNPVVKRGGRYTWAYLLKRPRWNSPEVVDMSVVVYGGRAVQLPGGENVYFAANDGGGANVLNVYWNPTADKPSFRKGVWVLDVTAERITPNPQAPTQFWDVPHGYFYRVVGVTDLVGRDPTTGLNVTQLELQSNLKAQLPPPPPIPLPAPIPLPQPNPQGARSQTLWGAIVLMEQVVEVFDRGSGWKP